MCMKMMDIQPALVALLVASQYVLPGYGVRRVWVRGPTGRIIVSGYSGVCFEIKFSGRGQAQRVRRCPL